MRKPTFISGLAGSIEAFVREKNALGFPYEQSTRDLSRFDRMCAERFPGEATVTREMALAWAERIGDEHPNTQRKRISPVRALAEYMERMGTPAFVIPRGFPVRDVRYTPYIYTREEIAALIEAADDSAASSQARIEPFRLIMPCVIRLLYTTGMRHGEARRLKRGDVDIARKTLSVPSSKNCAGRTVCISEEMAEFLERFDALSGDREWFFQSAKGGCPSQGWLQADFLALKYLAGIEEIGVVKRIHDIRHTHCVHVLDDWVREGRDINAMLPYLSASIGHKSIEATDYYLHLVPEFYGDYERLVEARSRVVPTIGGEDE